MEGYKPGQMSSLLFGQASPGSEKKKKKKAKKAEDGADLLALFNVKPAPVEIPIPAEPKVQDDDKKTDTQKTADKKKKKKKGEPKEETEEVEVSSRGYTEKQSGFLPPQGIVHEALAEGSTRRKKKQKMTKTDEREAQVLGVEPSKKEKVKKRQREDDEDEVPVMKKKMKKRVIDEDVDKRTVFIGNLPNTTTKKDIKKLFKKYGKVQSLRYRSAAAPDPSLPKKVAVITKNFHAERVTINAYVVFKDEETAQKATESNGTLIGQNHIRVDLAHNDKKVDHRRSVFIGNLPFTVKEEPLRDHFEECGEIANVRVIRDQLTGLGKGFGYILFKDQSSVELALKMGSKKFEDKVLRIERSVKKDKNKEDTNKTGKKKMGDKKTFTKPSNKAISSFQGVLAEKDKERRLKKKKKKFSKEIAGKGRARTVNPSNARKRLEAKIRRKQTKGKKGKK